MAHSRHPLLPPARTGAGEELERLRRDIAAQTQHLQTHGRLPDLLHHPLVQRSEVLTQRLREAARAGDPWRQRHAVPRPHGRLSLANLKAHLRRLDDHAAKEGRKLWYHDVWADCAQKCSRATFRRAWTVVEEDRRGTGRKPKSIWDE